MLLALDLGNTNITVGVFDGDKLLVESRIATDHKKMRDQYAVELSDILKLYRVDASSFDGAILCSVVPNVEARLKEAVKLICGIDTLVVAPGVKTGVAVRLDNPAQLGADLLVGAVATVAQYGAPAIVWDLGTATTISAVGKEGDFLGGVIMAGVNTSLNALVDKASLLPRIKLDAPPHVIGGNTVHSMQSGIIYGTASMIDEMSDRVEEEIGAPCKVVVTGGLARTVVPYCRRELICDDRLVLTGLRLIYEKNR